MPECFWNYSIVEIEDLIESYQRKNRMEQKLAIDKMFTLADAIISRFLPILDQNIKPTLPWDVYPKLFSEEKKEYEQAMEEEEFEKFKAGRRRFAAEHNQKMS